MSSSLGQFMRCLHLRIERTGDRKSKSAKRFAIKAITVRLDQDAEESRTVSCPVSGLCMGGHENPVPGID
jgi:hypothetical protein